jgi:hypothetical protein
LFRTYHPPFRRLICFVLPLGSRSYLSMSLLVLYLMNFLHMINFAIYTQAAETLFSIFLFQNSIPRSEKPSPPFQHPASFHQRPLHTHYLPPVRISWCSGMEEEDILLKGHFRADFPRSCPPNVCFTTFPPRGAYTSWSTIRESGDWTRERPGIFRLVPAVPYREMK